MVAMAKTNAFLSAILITLMICGLAFVGSMHFGAAQSGTNVNGIIGSDTTWTETNSPYNLTETVTVNNRVTLTVEAGATINLNGYHIEVNGTLLAEGTGANQIHINDNGNMGSIGIAFEPLSSAWNEQTGAGCIIENTVGFGWIIAVNDSSPNISQNTGIDIYVTGGSPTIWKNTFSISMGYYIDVEGGSPTISDNAFEGFMGTGVGYVYGIYLSGSNTAVISDNTFNGAFNSAIILNSGTPTVERNLIEDGSPNNNNPSGVGITIYDANPLIENNTIANVPVALNIYYESPATPPSPTIIYNNFENNSKNTVFLGQLTDVHGLNAPNIAASNNWWGTINQQAINQTIHDSKDNSNLGTVNFIPFLTKQNTEATPNPNVTVPTPSPSATSISGPSSSTLPSLTPSASQSNQPTSLPIKTLIFVMAIVIIAAAVGAFLLRKRTSKK